VVDYSVHPGDTVQYSVVPVVGPSKDKLSLDIGNASPLTPVMTSPASRRRTSRSFFNKGIVAAQWWRATGTEPKTSKIRDVSRSRQPVAQRP